MIVSLFFKITLTRDFMNLWYWLPKSKMSYYASSSECVAPNVNYSPEEMVVSTLKN